MPSCKDSFRMRHHRQVTPIFGTQSCNATRTSIWIERVCFSHFVCVIDVSNGDLVVLLYHVMDGLVREEESALSVSDPNAKG